MSETRIIYSEPVDYFPKEIREKTWPELFMDSDRYNEIARTVLSSMIDNSEENIVFSPYSIYALLTLISYSTAGITKDEVTEFLKNDESKGIDTFSVADRNLKQTKGFINANAVIVNEDYKDHIRNEYKDDIKDKMGAEVFSSENIVSEVNKWVKDRTKGMVPEIADDSMSEMVAGLIIGISMYDENRFDMSKWRGRGLLGFALMQVRDELNSETVEDCGGVKIPNIDID